MDFTPMHSLERSKCVGRRAFLRSVPWAVWIGGRAYSAALPGRVGAVVIGHTGRGDYGHGYDRIFEGVPGVELLAIADPDAKGRGNAMNRTGAPRGYADYRAMLDAEKPALVSIAFRQPAGHAEALIACMEAGVKGIFIEKPFTETWAEARRVLEMARRTGARIQVAHNRRWASDFVEAEHHIRSGLLGRVRDVRINGKQDHRAGGEDLMVLGTHDMDVLRWWFGDPKWVSGHLFEGDRPTARDDLRPARERFLMAGTQVHAVFGFSHGVIASWQSMKMGPESEWNTEFQRPREKWSFEVYGTKRILAYQVGLGFRVWDSPFPGPKDEGMTWQALPPVPDLDWPLHRQHPIRDLLYAMENSTDPLCSGHDGAWTIRMVESVYESHFAGNRLYFEGEE